jgi:hypothetical protein
MKKSLALAPLLLATACQTPWNESGNGQIFLGGTTPYLGSAVEVPGTVQAENFDVGPANVAYTHRAYANEPAAVAYRTDNALVHIDKCDTTSGSCGYRIGYVNDGDWLGYTINVKTAGPYSLAVKVSNPSADAKSIHVEIDGVNATGAIAIPNTCDPNGAGWYTWADAKGALTLSEGIHYLKLSADSGAIDFDSFTLTAGDTPPPPPTPMPGDRCYPANSALTQTTMPSVSMPGYLASITDPTFGTQVTRISDSGTFSNAGAGTTYHQYAKNQPWNADETRIMMDGWPAAILDGSTYRLLGTVMPPGEHHTWSNTNPNIIYGVNADDAQLVSVDVSDIANPRREVVASFPGIGPISYGEWEGNLSIDDRYIALHSGAKGAAVKIFTYDLVNKAMGATLDGQGVYPNNVSVTQSGKYVAVQWGVDGAGERQGIALYDRSTMNFERKLSMRGGTHVDYCIDMAGEEVMVVVAESSSDMIMVRLRDGLETTILGRDDVGYNLHVSCRNVKRPGYVYLSQFQDGVENKGYVQTVFAVALDGSRNVQRFAHEHHSDSTDYNHEAFGVPSRFGDRMMWRSDWDNASGPVYSYVARRVCQ